MRVALLSDTHGLVLPSIEENVDAIIHAGDVGPDRDATHWMFEIFAPWAIEVERPIYMTWGNHDFIGERLPQSTWKDLPPNVYILKDETIEIGGKQVWFSPWSPLFGSWAFMKPEGGLETIYETIPLDTQIIVSHTPPYGLRDRTLSYEHVGSTALIRRMDQLPLLEMVVCGHIHEARGTRISVGGVHVHNVSLVNEYYEMVHEPLIVEW